MNVIKGVIKWAMENPQNAVVTVATLLAGTNGISKIIRSANRMITARQNQYNKERYVYDHSLGIYLKTKRKLTKKDLQMIDRLRSRGFSKSQAMMKLNLIED